MPQTLRGARCLVTGAPGFVGSHLCDRLVEDGAEVTALTRQVSSVLPVRLAHLAGSVDIVPGDLHDAGSLRIVCARARPQYVFHLGAYTHVGKSFDHVGESLQTNIAGTVNLLGALAGTGYESFVYAGTGEVYGGASGAPFREDQPVAPLSPYAVAKHAGERYCRMFFEAYAWPIVMLRPFNAYGPRQSSDRIIPELVASCIAGVDIAMTEGRQTREFNYVTDIVDGFVRAALAGPRAHGEVVNVGCGEDISMRDLATRVVALMGDPVTPRFGALAHRPTEIWRMVCDATKARDLLGWTPTVSLDEGLRRTIAFYRAESERPGSAFLLSRRT